MAVKPTRRKSRATNHPVPQDRDEATAMIAEIGVNSRELQRIEADMNDAIAQIRERFEKQAEPLRERNVALHAGVQLFCEANRPRLTRDGAVKYHRFASGEVNWRQLPPRTTIKGADDVVAYCETHKLKRFIRVKKTIDREALLKEPEVARTVPGIAIGSAGEEFVIEPHEAELDQTG